MRQLVEPTARPDDNLGPFVLQLRHCNRDSGEGAGGRCGATWADWARNLAKLDQRLATKFGMRVQHTNEDGSTVRGVCGSEERTPIAYIPIGVGGCSGLLRAQIVPGAAPCLLPAYLLTDMGSIIDMVGLTMFHTTLGVTLQMYRRSTGHVEVCLAEYGRGFSMVVWTQAANALMIVAQQPCTDSRRPALGSPTRTFGTTSSGHELLEASRRTSPGKAPMLNTSSTRRVSYGPWRSTSDGVSMWPLCYDSRRPVRAPRSTAAATLTKCEARGAIEQIPKLTPDRMTEWNTVLVYQAPNYVTPQAKKDARQAKRTGTTTATSLTTPTATPPPTATTPPATTSRTAATAPARPSTTQTFGDHLRQTASSARLTARTAAASTA